MVACESRGRLPPLGFYVRGIRRQNGASPPKSKLSRATVGPSQIIKSPKVPEIQVPEKKVQNRSTNSLPHSFAKEMPP